MNLLNSVKQLFGKPATPRRPIQPLAPEPRRRGTGRSGNLTPAALNAEFAAGATPLLLDVRELYEWKQVRIPGAKHIPMGEIPARLAEIDKERPVVVFCAWRPLLWRHPFPARTPLQRPQPGRRHRQWHVQGGSVEVKTNY